MAARPRDEADWVGWAGGYGVANGRAGMRGDEMQERSLVRDQACVRVCLFLFLLFSVSWRRDSRRRGDAGWGWDRLALGWAGLEWVVCSGQWDGV